MELILLITFTMVVKAMAVDEAALVKSNCQNQCGGIDIPYPFGIGNEDCNMNRNFSIICNTSFHPPKPFLQDFDNIEVLNISLDGRLRIFMGVKYQCFYVAKEGASSDNWWSLRLPDKFSISNTRNKFTAIGCNTIAVLLSPDPNSYYAIGCTQFCNITDVIDGYCSGVGCCQTSFPKGKRAYDISIENYNVNYTEVLNDNPCNYAFIAEDGNYNFSISDIRGYDFKDRKFPASLDWTIGHMSCSEAKKDIANFACKENSTCVDSENDGYLCKCKNGYEGNPYLNGCQGNVAIYSCI